MTSVDLAEFFAEQKQQGPQCGIGRALALLASPDADNLRAALALDSRELQHQAIEAWCRKHGQPVGKGSVSRHRNGVCHCER